VHIALKPVERNLFETRLVLMADFRCAVDEKLFRYSGPSNANCIIFPSTCTKILRACGRATFEHPGDVSFMNRGEEYEREAISEEGTLATWYTLDDALLEELLFEANIPSLEFPQPQRHVPAQAILDQRRLFSAIRAGVAVDPMLVEEKLIALTRSIFGGTSEAASFRPAIVSRSTEYLLAHYTESLSLSDVARAAGASVSYVSRAFHAATGMTMSAFRQRLRLTRSLDLLPQYSRNVTELALDLGFSSHSHFTSCFRSVFDISPTEFLRLVR
jgi:AraC family transcriptional regulator